MREQIEALLNEMIAAHTTQDRQAIAAKILGLFPEHANQTVGLFGLPRPAGGRFEKSFLGEWSAGANDGPEYIKSILAARAPLEALQAPWQPVEIVRDGEGHPALPPPLPLAAIGSTDEPGHAFEVKNFPCGASASGPAPLPDTCPVHQNDPESCLPSAG